MMLVIFVEEPSMAETLKILLPKLGIQAHQFQIVTHQGKSDLEKSWRRKLPAWNVPDTNFLILRDNDGGDCLNLKQSLHEVAVQCGKHGRTSVRIVCQELEAWFLGDREALVQAGYLKQKARPKELEKPDSHLKPSTILTRWKSDRQKVSGAREIAEYMDPDHNQSTSFNHAMHAIRAFI